MSLEAVDGVEGVPLHEDAGQAEAAVNIKDEVEAALLRGERERKATYGNVRVCY